MASQISRDEALYILLYLTGLCDRKTGFLTFSWDVALEEGDYLKKVQKEENLKLDEDIKLKVAGENISVQGEMYGANEGDTNKLKDRCCNVLKKASLQERKKVISYMLSMADISKENDKDNISTPELNFIQDVSNKIDINLKKLVDYL